MDFLDLILTWIGLGLFFGTLLTIRDLNKGRDLTIASLIGAFITSCLMGPICLLILIHFDKVIIKGKKK